jgi:hypothetical protein
MPITAELKKLYADAAQAGLFIKEFPAEDGKFMAFAGNIKRLENAKFTKEKRKNMDHMMASLHMTGGGGDSREEAVKNAIEMYYTSEGWVPQA